MTVGTIYMYCIATIIIKVAIKCLTLSSKAHTAHSYYIQLLFFILQSTNNGDIIKIKNRVFIYWEKGGIKVKSQQKIQMKFTLFVNLESASSLNGGYL